jgi:hypothetical protein
MSSKRTIAVVSAVAALAFASVAAAAGGKGNHGAPQLNGTWLSQVSLVNPPPGIDATFQALNTFVPGGAVLVSSSQGHPTARSLAQGDCTHTAAQQYSCTFVWFRFDPTGAYIGTQRVRRTMTVSSGFDAFQSTDTIEVLAPDGTVLATLQGSETAHRLGR